MWGARSVAPDATPGGNFMASYLPICGREAGGCIQCTDRGGGRRGNGYRSVSDVRMIWGSVQVRFRLGYRYQTRMCLNRCVMCFDARVDSPILKDAGDPRQAGTLLRFEAPVSRQRSRFRSSPLSTTSQPVEPPSRSAGCFHLIQTPCRPPERRHRCSWMGRAARPEFPSATNGLGCRQLAHRRME